MPQSKLADIVLYAIEYFEMVDDRELDPDTAVKHLESIVHELSKATPEEYEALRQAARDRLAWFARERGEHEYNPRLHPSHRKLLEGIAFGDEFWHYGGVT